MELQEARQFALSLPEATEEPHFDMASFRVRGKIFATVPPDGDHLHVFVDEQETRALIAEEPQAFEELWWGKRLTGVRVHLPAADAQAVFELLEDAWRRRAPRRLVLAHSPKFQAILEKSRRQIDEAGGIPHAIFWSEVEGESREGS